MLKVYGRNDMFAKAKELFESIKDNSNDFSVYVDDCTVLKPDAYSYTSILEASASAHQWEYFEYVYKEMALCGFQLDQNKHTRLLVAASRAGKWHLLEHAIDSILEAGEVPHTSLFAEIVCQTIYQHNFERTVALINGMAHASMQISESQWTNIFLRDKYRLGKEKLENLLNHLDNSTDLVMEDPVPNFIRSVKSFGHILSNNTLELAAPTDDEENSIFHENAEVVKHSGRIQGYLPSRTLINRNDGLQPRGDGIASVNSNWIDNLSASNHMGVHFQERVDFDVVSSSLTGNQGKQSEYVQEGNTDSSVGDSSLDLLTNNIDSSFSNLPSASDILEAWKKDRIKDGMFPLNA